MPTRQQKADALIRRAAALEAQLARSIRDLEPGLIERFSQTVLELGIIDNEQLQNIFEAATARTMTGAFAAFAVDSAEAEGLPLALGRIQQAADANVGTLIQDLTDRARATLADSIATAIRERWSVPRLAKEVKKEIGLTKTQLRWVQNYEAELRTSPEKALARELRDRRFDPSLRKASISDEKIARMVERYRERWVNYRAKLIAQQELISASNIANALTWEQADAEGQVPSIIRKFWWHSHDTKVRDPHIQIPILNPRGVAVREAFVTPLGPMRYPCDPMGVAENRVRCRCVAIYESSNPEATR